MLGMAIPVVPLSGAYSRSVSSADASALYPYGLYSSDSQVPRAPSPSRSLQGLGSRLPPMIATFGTMDGHHGDHRRAHNQYMNYLQFVRLTLEAHTRTQAELH
ncbi:hypothetical protein B0H10DRAFT_2223598 [Mycena sp. CBHHK59/15]|nr:hypothetical protein B0H10DRAFT_2223598 [Mycena sp. CBHHK59/15]